MLRLYPDAGSRSSLWGLVLAAGDGKRLQGFIRKLRRENLPKQYVNFIGHRSMLEHTFDRVQRLIPAQRIITVVSKQHLEFSAARDQLARRARETVIVQPQNRDTGPGILLPLIHLHKRCPESIVALFPSDHFILEEERFMDHVRLAAHAVAHDPAQIVLLAVEAQDPETEYGYILPGGEEGRVSLWGLRSAAQFIEKPDIGEARQLMQAGALWNTMIMVFKLSTMLDLIQRFCAPTYTSLLPVFDAIGTPSEQQTVDEAYQRLEPMNFSSGLLERIAATNDSISVLPVLDVNWSDWGSPQRLLRTFELVAPAPKQARRRSRQPAEPRIAPLAWQRQLA